MSDMQHLRAEVVDFLSTVARPGCQVDRMDDDADLINAGVIDSLAVVQIIAYLEQKHDLHLQSSGIDPADLGTINGIVGAITRSGE
jgi:acyl carrier protein